MQTEEYHQNTEVFKYIKKVQDGCEIVISDTPISSDILSGISSDIFVIPHIPEEKGNSSPLSVSSDGMGMEMQLHRDSGHSQSMDFDCTRDFSVVAQPILDVATDIKKLLDAGEFTDVPNIEIEFQVSTYDVRCLKSIKKIFEHLSTIKELKTLKITYNNTINIPAKIDISPLARSPGGPLSIYTKNAIVTTAERLSVKSLLRKIELIKCNYMGLETVSNIRSYNIQSYDMKSDLPIITLSQDSEQPQYVMTKLSDVLIFAASPIVGGYGEEVNIRIIKSYSINTALGFMISERSTKYFKLFIDTKEDDKIVTQFTIAHLSICGDKTDEYHGDKTDEYHVSFVAPELKKAFHSLFKLKKASAGKRIKNTDTEINNADIVDIFTAFCLPWKSEKYQLKCQLIRSGYKSKFKKYQLEYEKYQLEYKEYKLRYEEYRFKQAASLTQRYQLLHKEDKLQSLRKAVDVLKVKFHNMQILNSFEAAYYSTEIAISEFLTSDDKYNLVLALEGAPFKIQAINHEIPVNNQEIQLFKSLPSFASPLECMFEMSLSSTQILNIKAPNLKLVINNIELQFIGIKQLLDRDIGSDDVYNEPPMIEGRQSEEMVEFIPHYRGFSYNSNGRITSSEKVALNLMRDFNKLLTFTNAGTNTLKFSLECLNGKPHSGEDQFKLLSKIMKAVGIVSKNTLFMVPDVMYNLYKGEYYKATYSALEFILYAKVAAAMGPAALMVVGSVSVAGALSEIAEDVKDIKEELQISYYRISDYFSNTGNAGGTIEVDPDEHHSNVKSDTVDSGTNESEHHTWDN